jgi:hypothetical protein
MYRKEADAPVNAPVNAAGDGEGAGCGEDGLTDFDIPPPLPAELFYDLETANRIAGLVDALPLAQRACVYFYYFSNLTVTQIAEMFQARDDGGDGGGEDMVKLRLAMAKDKIRRELDGDNGLKPARAHPILIAPALKMAARGFDVPDGGMIRDAIESKIGNIHT